MGDSGYGREKGTTPDAKRAAVGKWVARGILLIFAVWTKRFINRIT
jgi:hypothetical protein